MKEDFFDAEVLRSIETMDVADANTLCIKLITESKTKAVKKQHLIRDINAADSSKEKSRIMWNVMLSGMGLATVDSHWQATH